MFEDLKQIKALRRKMGISQKELSLAAGVSQSLIAKIEAGTLEPTFSKVKAIFFALDNFRGREEPKVKSFMHKKVVFAAPKDKLPDVVSIMKKRGISQIPIKNNNGVLGVVTESSVLDAITEHGAEFNLLKCEDVMEECPPIVSINAGQKMVLELLKEYPLVLVSDNGEIIGLVSKADLLTAF